MFHIISLYRIRARSSLPAHVWRLTWLCQPSTSLLVQTDDWKADRLLSASRTLWSYTWLELSLPGAKVHWNFRSQEQKFQRNFACRSESFRDGTFAAASKSSWERNSIILKKYCHSNSITMSGLARATVYIIDRCNDSQWWPGYHRPYILYRMPVGIMG